MSDQGITSVKLVAFDGQERKFREWRCKTEAIGYANNWADRLSDETRDVLLINPETQDKQEQVKLDK